MRSAAITLALALSIAIAPSSATADKRKAPSYKHTLITAKQLKSSRALCETKWPASKKPSQKMTDRCMQYWLFTHASYARPSTLDDDDAFSMDPIATSSSKKTAAYYRTMASLVRRAFPDDAAWVTMRAVEFFESSADSYTSYFDMNVDLPEGLRTVLAGKPYKPHMLAAAANPNTVWFLRNAVYARHGRKFKHPDLNHYFYGKWKRPDEVKGLLPLAIDPAFKESMLTRTDRANVRAIDKNASAPIE